MNFKKRTNFLFGVLLLTGSLLAQNVCVSTPKTSLVLSAPEGGTLRHLYYGNRLSEADLQNISAAEANHEDLLAQHGRYYQLYTGQAELA